MLLHLHADQQSLHLPTQKNDQAADLQKLFADTMRNPLLFPKSLSESHLIYQDSNPAFNLIHPLFPRPGQYHSLTSPGQCHGFSASRCSFLFPCANTSYYKDEIGFLNSWVKHGKEMTILTAPDAHWCWSDYIILLSLSPLLDLGTYQAKQNPVW